MSSKPTLVFVPGAWHLPACYDKVVVLLENRGYKSVCPPLPTVSSNASATYKDDIETIQNAIVAETKQGKDVVVISHSYGGMVGNSAIKGLARPKADSAITNTNTQFGFVVGNILIASGFTQTGVGFLEGLGGKPPPIWNLNEETGLAELTVPARDLFYHDLPVEEGDAWVSKLGGQSLGAFREYGELSYAGWTDVPTWYLVTTEDKSFPTEVQRMMVQMAKDAGADVQSRDVQSSHSPMLSKPVETAKFIEDAVANFTR